MLLVSLAVFAASFGPAASAGSKYGYSSYGYGQSSKKYYEYQSRETARQQAEMEKELREQQKQAEKAQREADKEAARLQTQFEAEQRRAQEQAMRDAERQRQQAQREMAAQQRQAQQEAERARQQAQRDMQAAQRRAQQEAERQAQQAAEKEAQRAAQRQEQLSTQRDAQRTTQSSWQNTWDRSSQGDRSNQGQQQAARASTPSSSASKTSRIQDRNDDGDEDDDLDDDLKRESQDDESNPNLSATERRVREIERLRRMEERRQARAVLAFKRRNDERTARARTPEAPRLGDADDKDRDAAREDAPSAEAAEQKDDAQGEGGASGNEKMLSGWQKQAMRLGAQRGDAGTGRGSVAERSDASDEARSRRRRDGDSAKANDDASGPGDAKLENSKTGKSKRDDDGKAADRDTSKGASAAERKSARSSMPPPGAELPPEQFEEERDQEIVVPELSPEEVATAEAQGLVVSAPTEIGKAGTKMVRVRLRGGDRSEAERELHRVLPFASAMPNYAYKIFLGSEGQSAGLRVPGQKSAPASDAPCPASVCFGSQLIKWTPALTRCVRDVRVGVIDTSFDTSHPAFKNLKSIGREFLDGSEASPYDWHGTAVLSLLAGDPMSGTPGLVPDATFLLAAAFRSDVNGNASTDTVRLLAALAWLEELDVDIVNMSFSGPEDPSLARAIARMSKKGIVFVGAAGNMGPTASPSYPAAYPNVIAVTAVSRDSLNYKNANRGTYIDLSAPGVDILAALPHAQQGLRTGTSFAAPFVTAIIAAGGAGPAQSVSMAKLAEKLPFADLGPPGQDPIYGAGLALAPQTCAGSGHGGEVATSDESVPRPDPWAAQTTTTFIHAGASFAP